MKPLVNHGSAALCCALLLLYACKKEDSLPAVPAPVTVAPAVPVKMVQKPMTISVGNAVRGLYVALPSDYEASARRLPLLVYLPGAGQFGNGANDLPLLLNDGMAQLLDEGIFPTNIKAGNASYSFIVVTPQFTWWPATTSVDAVVEWAKKNYRVDTSRIYLSGLSMGGILASDLAVEQPGKFAAIVPMSGVSKDYDLREKAKVLANGHVHVWAFHSADDQVYSIGSIQDFINNINAFNPTLKAKLTVWPTGGHDAWTKALNPKYKEEGLNIYEWMLQFSR